MGRILVSSVLNKDINRTLAGPIPIVFAFIRTHVHPFEDVTEEDGDASVMCSASPAPVSSPQHPSGSGGPSFPLGCAFAGGASFFVVRTEERMRDSQEQMVAAEAGRWERVWAVVARRNSCLRWAFQ